MVKKIIVHDVTLRDGSHAIGHQLTLDQIDKYVTAADAAKIPEIEVGHGNGIGASSLQVGKSLLSDDEMIIRAKNNISYSKLGIFVIPGFATINKNLKRALDLGVDIVRVATHCTEADISQRHINYVRSRGKEAYGVLMMSHMAPIEILIEEAQKMESYGAEGVILFDSAGAYFPDQVEDRIFKLNSSLKIPVGFHAHNNLGFGIANSIAAIKAGATIIDGSARGFGAGAGNAQIEVLIAVLGKLEYDTGIDLYKALDTSDIAEKWLIKDLPSIKPVSIVSGLNGVFSGYSKVVTRISKEFNVDPRDVFYELGQKKVVAGQEDIILEVVHQLASKNLNSNSDNNETQKK